MKSVLARKKEKHRLTVGYPVTQYDLTRKRIASYPSMTDAGEAVGVKSNKISRPVTGHYKSMKGYIWKKGYGKPFINLSSYKWGLAAAASSRSKKVKQYSLTGEYIQTFDSITAAAVHIGVNMSTLSEACRKKSLSSKGYKWRLA